MIWAAALYLRGRPLAAGVLLGLGATAKLVAPYLLLVLLLVELARRRRGGYRVAARALAEITMVSVAVYFAVLAAFDRIAPPYDPQTGRTIRAGPLAHTERILGYASGQTSPHGPTGIASYPWDWLIDMKPINYLNVTVSSVSSRTATVHFLGLISPPILLFALPALLLAVCGAWRGIDADVTALAWFLGTWLPFAVFSLFLQRTTYLYYMVIVMPGIYLALARAFSRPWMPRWALGGWLVLVAAAAVLAYPFLALPAVNFWGA
jgi:hypothetical protein